MNKSTQVATRCHGCNVTFSAQFKLPYDEEAGTFDFSKVAKSKRYCSPQCKDARSPYTHVAKVCGWCDRGFQVKVHKENLTKALHGHDSKFCSQGCRDESKAKDRWCEVCGDVAYARRLCMKHYTAERRHGDPRAIPKKAAAGEHRMFLDVALQQETDECIIWPEMWSSVNDYGYASLQEDGMILAHVYVCEKTHGPRPDGLQSAHSCGVRKCVNKRHLRWATPSENELDKRTHGTDLGGQRNPQAKLTEDDVVIIRQRFGQGEVQSRLAYEFDVTQASISKVVNGKKWKFVESQCITCGCNFMPAEGDFGKAECEGCRPEGLVVSQTVS